jgi:membrane fusion protein (multidrug efflux system)
VARDGRWVPTPIEEGLQNDFSGVGWYVVVALALGLALGALTAFVLDHAEILGVVVALLGSALAAYLVLTVGERLSPPDPDRVAAESAQGVARVGEIRATIERKTIRAPFTGVLGIRQVNLGQYLTGGAPIVPLQSLDPVYVNFGVPQQNVPDMKPGRRVTVTSSDAGGLELSGRVNALDSVIDSTTRNVQVQATFANPGGKLRPGMFVQTRVTLGAAQPLITVPASAISYAPYGDSVFIVTDLKNPEGVAYKGVRQQVVKLGGARGDQIAVLSGINPQEEVVTSGVFKLRNGVAVQVNNKVQPANSAAPTTEDR